MGIYASGLCVGALLAHVQGTVDLRALQPSPGPLAQGPRPSPVPLKRPHADIKESRTLTSYVDTTDKQRWTLNHRASGCSSGRRNADAHECLHAIEEAVVGIYVVAGFKVLTNFEHATPDGWSSGIPSGCSYSNVTQRAIFNHNKNSSNFHNVKDNYRHVCTNDITDITDEPVRLGEETPKAETKKQDTPKKEVAKKGELKKADIPKKEEAKKEGAPKKVEPKNADTFTAGKQAAADIGKFISYNPHKLVDSFKSEGGPYPQFVCDTETSVLETCPNIVAASRQDAVSLYRGPTPNLTIPASARLLFAGPDHLMEVYATVLAANGGCVSRENGTVCVLSNGAKIAFLRSLGQEETDELAASLSLTHWTHGFFMEPHGPPYKGEHVGERYWQLREVLSKRRKDPTGPDMCLPLNVKDGTPTDSKTGFADYENCVNSKPHLLRFRRLLRGADRTLAVPWHVAPPPNHDLIKSTYFTRPWAVMMDCSPNLRPRPEASASLEDLTSSSFLSASPTPSRAARASPAPSAGGKAPKAAPVHASHPSPSPSPSAGGKVLTDHKAKTPTSFFRSLAKRNPHGVREAGGIFNPMDGQILADLQCVTVCEPAATGQSCHYGSIAWMAHDLLALAK